MLIFQGVSETTTLSSLMYPKFRSHQRGNALDKKEAGQASAPNHAPT